MSLSSWDLVLLAPSPTCCGEGLPPALLGGGGPCQPPRHAASCPETLTLGESEPLATVPEAAGSLGFRCRLLLEGCSEQCSVEVLQSTGGSCPSRVLPAARPSSAPCPGDGSCSPPMQWGLSPAKGCSLFPGPSPTAPTSRSAAPPSSASCHSTSGGASPAAFQRHLPPGLTCSEQVQDVPSWLVPWCWQESAGLWGWEL